MQGSLSPASVASRRDTDGVVGCRGMQAASKHGFWARTGPHGSGMAITPVAAGSRYGCFLVEEAAARSCVGTSYSRPSNQL